MTANTNTDIEQTKKLNQMMEDLDKFMLSQGIPKCIHLESIWKNRIHCVMLFIPIDEQTNMPIGILSIDSFGNNPLLHKHISTQYNLQYNHANT